MAKQNDNEKQDNQKHTLEYGETQPPRGDIKEQSGGPQDNQLTGQTEKAARNQEMKGKNPQGNPPDRCSR